MTNWMPCFPGIVAKGWRERNEHVSKNTTMYPYLNSSLFEPTELGTTPYLSTNLSDDKNPGPAQTRQYQNR